MGEELKRAVVTGNIGAFYGVVEREGEIQKMLELEETPLHVATEHGNTELAIEILGLRPSFGKKLNPSGYSPLDLAMRNGHGDTVKQLIKLEPDLLRVQSRERKNPLHYVAETNNADLLAEFLFACPSAVKELTVRGETAVHLAVLTKSSRAFEVLMSWISRTDNKKMLGWKDNKGNTVLHMAALTSQAEVVKRLLKEKVEVDIKNEENQTVFDIVVSRCTSSQEHVKSVTSYDVDVVEDKVPNQLQEDLKIKKMLEKAGSWESSKLPSIMSKADFLTSYDYHIFRKAARSRVDLEKGITEGRRNVFLVVSVLILTATFQAFLSPPGGGWLDNNNNSDGDLLPDAAAPAPISNMMDGFDSDDVKQEMFYPFVFVNSITFVTSLGLTLLMIPFGHYNHLLSISLLFLMITYVMCGIIITPLEKQVITLGILLAGFAAFYALGLTWILLTTVMRRKRFWWLPTKRDIVLASVYEMERQVRLSKYVA